jgi:anthranilate phosphoribosyltransferase
MNSIDLPRVIKAIGRGRHAGDLSREDAEALFAAILDGRVADLELGAALIALRVKGESLEELAGFLGACEASYAHLEAPVGTIPIVIPSYNGARVLPNLVPLLASLLAREGIPVLVHGVTRDAGRVTTCEVLEQLGVLPAAGGDEAESRLASERLAFLPITTIAPALARVLALRIRLGVRNSAHTLVKMLRPFSGPTIRLVSVTHPDYLMRMEEYFTRYVADALLLRGAEGEAVAHPRRQPIIKWAHDGAIETWTAPREEAVALPAKEAADTARWIHAALDGRVPIPPHVMHQVKCCKRALLSLRGTP